MVAFQGGEPTGQSEQQLPLGKGGSLKVPEELNLQLNNAPESIARPIPRFAVDVDLESYVPDPILTTTANIKDVCWLLTRHYRTPDQSVPSWMSFNQLTITNKQQVTPVGYLPINASVHESTQAWFERIIIASRDSDVLLLVIHFAAKQRCFIAVHDNSCILLSEGTSQHIMH